jgi:hypothetical protein
MGRALRDHLGGDIPTDDFHRLRKRFGRAELDDLGASSSARASAWSTRSATAST